LCSLQQTAFLLVCVAAAFASGASHTPPAIEDARARAALPLYKTIPAAPTDELTPALISGRSVQEQGGNDWTRSQGNAENTRYSPLTEITPHNVNRLKVAWIYHSNDGKANIQCNPIVVHGIMYAPTAGKALVAVNAETGKEIWRFDPKASPVAQRGLLYWPGGDRNPARILFTAGKFL